MTLPGYAAPRISGFTGQLGHGNSITISGSEFGAKTPAAPARFEDFEENNSLRVGGDSWDSNWWGTGISYSRSTENADGRQGSYTGKTNDLHSSNDGGVAGIQFPDDNDYVYAFRKEYYGFQPVNAYPNIINHKVFRVWNSNTNNSYCPNLGNRSYTVEQIGGNNGSYAPSVPLHQWNTSENALKNSSIGQRDGKIAAWYNNQGPHDILTPSSYIEPASDQSIDRIQTRNETYPGKLVRAFIEHALNNNPRPPVGSYVWVDDLYIDNTWSRVMIGDRPAYDECTVREIQIPSEWSSDGTSIHVTVNQGGLTSFEGKYLFVVDNDGNISDGFPLTSDSQGDSENQTPYLSGRSPGAGASGFFRYSNIVLHLQDTGEGVDINSIRMSVNGQSVAPDISGTSSDYTLSYDPTNPLEGKVVVTIDAQDLASPANAMLQESYSFTVNELRIVDPIFDFK
jgi:hypothetical protein